MEVPGIVAVTVGAIVGIPAIALTGSDAVRVLKQATRPPVAVAYAVSATMSVLGLIALTVLVAIGTRVSMPYFVAAYPGFLVAVVLHGIRPIRILRAIAALTAAFLYWNIDVTLHKPLVASATPLVVHHCIVALFIKDRT